MDAVKPAAPAALRIRFEIPRLELDRAEAAAEAIGAARAPASFELDHLRGRILFDLGVPLQDDPLLRHLERLHHLKTKPPFTVALDQPVAHLLAQAAGGAVLALHGEGDFSIRLTGGRGALSVAADEESLLLGLPLEAYAGTAAVPRADAAHAIAAACTALAALLAERPALSRLPLAQFLAKEAHILAADASSGAAPLQQTSSWAVSARGLAEHLTAIERGGAHVIPYWRTAAVGLAGRIRFEPVRTPGRAERAGAIAFAIRPRREDLIEANVPGDPAAGSRMRTRLKRRTPFEVDTAAGFKVIETQRELPMA